MARKPAPLELAGGKGLRQRIWDRMRKIKADGAFGINDLLVGDEIESIATAREYLAGLLRAGFIAISVPRAGNRPALYRLVHDIGAEAPRVRKDGTPVTLGLAQEQMWRTLCMLGGDINARELAAHASTDAVPVRESAACDYLRNLYKAGYLRQTAAGKGIGRGRGGTGVQSRYRLVRHTGPRPPMICRAHAVYDPNLDRVVWRDAVTEEDAIYGN
jgi:hypothetical protein